MSGGSMDYVYHRVNEAADLVEQGENGDHKPSQLERALAAHLRLCATALYEIEWARSGDTKPGKHDVPAIQRALADSPLLELPLLFHSGSEWSDEKRARQLDEARADCQTAADRIEALVVEIVNIRAAHEASERRIHDLLNTLEDICASEDKYSAQVARGAIRHDKRLSEALAGRTERRG